jgi:HEAT repeat protein
MNRTLSIALILSLFGLAYPVQAQEKFLGKPADAWVRELKTSTDAKQRRNAAYALGKMGGRAYVHISEIQNAYAKETDAKARDTLLYGMGEICRDSAAANANTDLEKLFLSAIKADDAHLRRSAAFALGCLGSRSDATRTALDLALNDDSALVRQNAAWALGQFGSAALPSLQRALRDADSLVKRDAASALLQMEEPDKVRELLKDLLPLCRDTNSEVRRAALNVLVRIVDPTDKDAIPSLLVAMEDRDIDNRRNAALALSNIGGEETGKAVPILLEAAKNGDVELRRLAVLAIRNIGPAAGAAVNDLIRILGKDKDAKSREFAALALGGIGRASEPAVPLLVEKIKDVNEEREVRIESAMALARVGPVRASTPIVPALLDILADRQQDPRVRERVIWALRVHGGNLRTMKGPLEAFTQILGEERNPDNKMLRYDCAYMLGMIWQKQAPDQTLDVLHQFLLDADVKIYQKTNTGVEGAGSEIQGGRATVKELGAGDGRIMAAEALQMMGPSRYASRKDIVSKLRTLAADEKTDAPLRKKCIELTK